MFTQKRAFQLFYEAIAHPYDIIIVPGVPYDGKNVTTLMRRRVCWSKYLFQSGATKNIMYSGGAVYSPYCESKIMALLARALDIPANVIYTETKAEHSIENIYYSYEKCRLIGFSKIAIATNPFQIAVLKAFTSREMCDRVGFIPFVRELLRTVEAFSASIEASSAFEPSFVSIRRRKNWWQRLKGTTGHYIDKRCRLFLKQIE